MKPIMAVVLSMALVGGVMAAQAQQGTAPAATTKSAQRKKTSKASGPAISEQLSEMKQAIEAQQQQIKQLTDLVQGREQRIQQLEQRLDQSQTTATQAQTKADTAVAQTAEQGQTVTALRSDVTDLKTSATNVALTLQETQKGIKDALESPVAIHFKGVTLTPGGFLAAESVYRTHATGGDATPFNNIAMPGSGQNRISEFFGSGRQSRVSLLAEGKFSDVKLTGYFETDFLSAGVTSNNNQTNSYTMRQRQAWGQAAFSNGWTFTGGQMWTLATETRKGVDNRTEAVPSTIDPNYTAGFSFARQWGVRLAKNFDNHFWLAASLENPQTTFAVTNANSNFALGSGGVGAGLYNSAITNCTTNATTSVTTCALAGSYSFNAMPDIIVKAAFEPGFGHYELFGIFSRFRDRVYPCAVAAQDTTLCGSSNTVTGAYNYSRNGGGLGANGRITVAKHVEFGLHALYGNGVGRYSASGLPDATVDPLGKLVPLRSYQGLATLEFHFPRLDVYLNGGEDYVGRRYQLDSLGNGNFVGYGAPGTATVSKGFFDYGCYAETLPSASAPGGYNFGGLSNCSGQTQRVIEGSMGFWIKLHSGPKGRLQFGPQYSYISRDAWTGNGSSAAGTFTPTAPHGIENLFYTSFRYYLP